jgi:hypothetical protein
MEEVIIVNMGVEGGGVTIFGRQADGVWSFRQVGGSIDFDDNDEECWRSWSRDPVSELAEALPREWYQMCPIEIHPQFVEQMRHEYERSRDLGGRSWNQFRHKRWDRLFTGAGPDAEPSSAADGEGR